MTPELCAAFFERLRQRMAVGDMDGAKADLEREGDPEMLVAQLPEGSAARMSAAAVAGEILLVYGSDTAALRLLKPYAESSPATVDARQQLQLAEYDYALFEPEYARTKAKQVLRAARSAEEVAECSYYLARFSLRQNKYDEASNACMAGLEQLHRDAQGLSQDALSWQTGRLLRVRGTALWWMGRLTEATAVLYLAAWLLKNRTGSRIYVGDALHSLGRLLRSLGPERYQEAIRVLGQARDHYLGHDLKRARTLTDLGRTHQNYGLQLERQNDADGASDNFGQSKRCFEEALALSEKQRDDDEHPIVWTRQKLDTLIWMSWFHQEVKAFADAALALAEAESAVALAVKHMLDSPEHIEAGLALGHCLLKQGRATEARLHLDHAAGRAAELKIPKLRFHASLCLAQWECAAKQNLQQARLHYDEAVAMRAGDKEFTGYLGDKAKAVGEEIDALARTADHFIFSQDDLLTRPIPDGWTRIKVMRCLAEKWAIDVAERRKNSLPAAPHDHVGVSVGTVRDIRARHEKLMSNAAPPAAGNVEQAVRRRGRPPRTAKP
jgi:tetratricopeptide (TPR) repeat protein